MRRRTVLLAREVATHPVAGEGETAAVAVGLEVAPHGVARCRDRAVLVLVAEVPVDLAVPDRRGRSGLELDVAADARAGRHLDQSGALALDVAVDVDLAGVEPGAVPDRDVALHGGADELTGRAGRDRDVAVDGDGADAALAVAGGRVRGQAGRGLRRATRVRRVGGEGARGGAAGAEGHGRCCGSDQGQEVGSVCAPGHVTSVVRGAACVCAASRKPRPPASSPSDYRLVGILAPSAGAGAILSPWLRARRPRDPPARKRARRRRCGW